MKNVDTKWILFTILRIVGVFSMLISTYYAVVILGVVKSIDDSINGNPQPGNEFFKLGLGYLGFIALGISLLVFIASLITIFITSKKLKKLKLQTK